MRGWFHFICRVPRDETNLAIRIAKECRVIRPLGALLVHALRTNVLITCVGYEGMVENVVRGCCFCVLLMFRRAVMP